MSHHEINDKASPKQEGEHKNELNLIAVHENDKSTSRDVESIRRDLEANEKAIEAARARVADIARRAELLKGCCEPQHHDTMKECAARGAAKNQPAYIEFQKRFCK